MATATTDSLNPLSQVSDPTDSLFNIGSDLETVIGKMEALEALIGRLADDAGDDALLFFSLLYSTTAIREEANGVFHRLHDRASAQNGSA